MSNNLFFSEYRGICEIMWENILYKNQQYATLAVLFTSNCKIAYKLSTQYKKRFSSSIMFSGAREMGNN